MLSCKAQLPTRDFSRAIQLKEGSYWVYNSKNASGTQNDSTYVKELVSLNGRKYSRFENAFGLSALKRDSLGRYIVDDSGKIEFDAYNLSDTLFIDSNKLGFMAAEIETVTVPCGTFETILFLLVQKNAPGVSYTKTSPAYFNDEYVLIRKVWYANDVGIIKSRAYYGFDVIEEKALLRYKVN